MALLVDAQVPPTVIDKVKLGQTVDMRFTTFNQNITPVIPGTVKLVSPDKMPDPSGNKSQDFYLAQVEATPEGLKQLGNLKIQPGMPVDVVFKTGERTFLSYLFKPLSDRFSGSFKNWCKHTIYIVRMKSWACNALKTPQTAEFLAFWPEITLQTTPLIVR